MENKFPFHKNKYFRAKNVFEKIIMAEVKRECRPRKSSLWGQPCDIAPAYVDTGRGDRKQLVYVAPIDTRPNYYVLRIDSKEDVGADNYDWDGMLLVPIEGVYDNVDRYEHYWDKGRYMGKERYADEDPKEMEWPMLHWSGGSWGQIKNYITHSNNK
jgi:hypothetical protein